MSFSVLLGALLAAIGDNFPASGPRRNWSDLGAYGLVALVAAAAALVVLQLRKRNDMSERCNKPWKLFRELCQVHGLDRPSQRLLAQLARARRLPQPAQVFVTPQAFSLEGLPAELQQRASQLRQLQQQLF
jgi:hypothetical protein